MLLIWCFWQPIKRIGHKTTFLKHFQSSKIFHQNTKRIFVFLENPTFPLFRIFWNIFLYVFKKCKSFQEERFFTIFWIFLNYLKRTETFLFFPKIYLNVTALCLQYFFVSISKQIWQNRIVAISYCWKHERMVKKKTSAAQLNVMSLSLSRENRTHFMGRF